MKKLSLFFAFLILLSGLVSSEIFSQQSSTKRKIPIKSTTGVPIFRSPIYSPVEVFIYGDVLMINFQEAIKGILVKIENIETNETVLLNSYDAEIGTIIDIPLYEAGKYQISFSSETYQGYGEFIVY